MLKKSLLFIVLIIFYVMHLHAQDAVMSRSIQPVFMLDTYYSTIGSRGADVWGFKGGVEVNHQWRFAAGYNKITSDIVERKRLYGDDIIHAGKDSAKAQLYMKYFPVMAEYIAHHKDPWEVSFPVQIGYGKSYFQYYDLNNEGRKIFNHGVLIMDAGVAAQYKIIRWVGVGAGLGYRVMLVNNPDIDTKFNTPVFSFRIKLFLNEIMHSLFPRGPFKSSQPQ